MKRSKLKSDVRSMQAGEFDFIREEMAKQKAFTESVVAEFKQEISNVYEKIEFGETQLHNLVDEVNTGFA
jgi:hypothetical protein